MLATDENVLLTQVGPGTDMGALLRHYWLPALLSSELPERDCRPLRTRLLGEDLVAFRDSSGAVGVVSEYCLHRGASLYFGRNEECGIRCVYHGWKYDRSGQCVDTPNERPTSRFKEQIRLRAYRVHERRGIIWVHMGEAAEVGEPPWLEWNTIPDEQVVLSKRFTRANWAQVLEGGIDSSHGQFLHRGTIASALRVSRDTHPVYELMDTEYGAMIAARRDMPDGASYFWRVYQFLMPFYTMVPSNGGDPIIGHAFVPRDDTSTMVWSVTWHPTRPIEPAVDLAPGSPLAIHAEEYRAPTYEADSQWIPLGGRDNSYLLDWERQRSGVFSGIPGIALQDAAMQESMGAVYSRSEEHLGASDAAIVRVRRRWMALARSVREGGADIGLMPGERAPEQYRVRSCSLVLSKEHSWLEEVKKYLKARPGVYETPPLVSQTG